MYRSTLKCRMDIISSTVRQHHPTIMGVDGNGDGGGGMVVVLLSLWAYFSTMALLLKIAVVDITMSDMPVTYLQPPPPPRRWNRCATLLPCWVIIFLIILVVVPLSYLLPMPLLASHTMLRVRWFISGSTEQVDGKREREIMGDSERTHVGGGERRDKQITNLWPKKHREFFTARYLMWYVLFYPNIIIIFTPFLCRKMLFLY